MSRLSEQQREALELLRDAEAREITVRTSVVTYRPADGEAWYVNGPTATALERRGLLRRHAAAHLLLELTDAGRRAIA